MAPASADVVAARDKAILDVLKIRPWSTEGLLAVMPAEPGLAPEHKAVALNSALIRLGVKKRIRSVEGKWALA